MAIILIDNKTDQLEVLEKGINEGWGKFLEMSPVKDLTEPQIIKIQYEADSSNERDITDFVNDVVANYDTKLKMDKVLILVDLFLTDKEENDKGPQKKFEEYSGYKLGDKIKNDIKWDNFRVAIMSKFFQDVDSTTDSSFGRLILKPLYREMKKPMLRYGHTLPMSIYCSMYYNLPEVFNTRDVVQAYCNIIFCKHFNLDKEGTDAL